MRGLLITATDTGVGKTAVTCGIARALVAEGRKVGVLKPVATGGFRTKNGLSCEDGEALCRAIGGHTALDQVVPIILEPALAPPVAARIRGEELSWEHLRERVEAGRERWRRNGADILLVEGVGGVLCPLAETATVADLAIQLDYPVLLVARRGLGTINHILLSYEALRRRGLRIAGLVLNASEAGLDAADPAVASNPQELARLLPGVPVLGQLDHEADPDRLFAALARLDWWERAEPPRVATERLDAARVHPE